jgi:molybdenum cofactor cytidylyltransferase
MKFARFPIDDAVGAILAHSITTPSGVIKKGRLLSSVEVGYLRAAGLQHIVAARPEPGDVGEDEASRRVATAAIGALTHAAAPFTGRANIFADQTGLAVIDKASVVRLNAIDEGLTIATVPPFERVTAGQMLATVKVITFALPEAVVARAEEILAEAPGGLISVHAFQAKTAGLVLTRMKSTKPTVIEKRRRAIEQRLVALGASLGPVETVAHEEKPVADAIARMREQGADPIIVFAASAIVDRGDIIPAALLEAGGEILRLGMPVDPGNLLLLGRLGEADVIGAPSCAASPKINGFDRVLERRLAGVEVSADDMAAMGLGGLLKEIPSRPQPRNEPLPKGTGGSSGAQEAMASEDDDVRRAPRIAAVVLAAGRSTRFGTSNKLLADLDGAPLVRSTVRAVLKSRARPVIVVTGHEAKGVAEALAGLDVTIVHNPNFADGLSTSLKAGIKALPPGIDGAVLTLGDMPGISGTHIDRLIAGFSPKEGRSIVVPVHQAKRGNPVLFSSAILPEMAEIEGDTGARHIIGQHAEDVAEVDLGTDAIFVDVDTIEALADFKTRRQPAG